MNAFCLRAFSPDDAYKDRKKSVRLCFMSFLFRNRKKKRLLLSVRNFDNRKLGEENKARTDRDLLARRARISRPCRGPLETRSDDV